MKYQVEKVSDCRKEVQPLIEKHWAEIALNQDAIKLNPDWDMYNKLESLGMLYAYTAREGDKIVGYFTVVATKGLHYADHVFASCDIIYILPEYRKGRAGLGLIKFVEEDLKSKNISSLTINTKCHSPFDGLLEYLEFELTERLYSKYIGD